MEPSLAVPAPRARLASAPFTLAVLALVYLLNFLDRTLIYILFGSIKAEMSFSDTQLALLGSTSFVIFYTVLGVPFGKLADRVSRRKMIAVGLCTWSVFSGMTGFAHDFWTLFACRVMVGVGEATLGPAALSWLADIFPRERRATAHSIYSAGVPLGAASAFFLGGWIGQNLGWRPAFWVLGFPGLALAVVILLLPEPARAAAPAPGSAAAGPARSIFAAPALRWHMGGYALAAIAANSLSIWVPSLLTRVHGVPLATLGLLSGASMAVSGGLATGFGGAVADRWERRGVGGRLRFGATLALVAAPVWLALIWIPAVPVAFLAFGALAGLGLAWLGPAAADVHDLVDPRDRGVAIASYFFVVNAIGYGIAPPTVGWLSDRLGGGAEGLQWALLSAPICCIAAAAVLWRAAALKGTVS